MILFFFCVYVEFLIFSLMILLLYTFAFILQVNNQILILFLWAVVEKVFLCFSNKYFSPQDFLQLLHLLTKDNYH